MKRSIQHRCPHMAQHHNSGTSSCHPRLPLPCPDCYSLIVTSEQIPYQPSEGWQDINEDGAA